MAVYDARHDVMWPDFYPEHESFLPPWLYWIPEGIARPERGVLIDPPIMRTSRTYEEQKRLRDRWRSRNRVG